MMNPGFSKPWPESLKALTGSDKMDATSLITYFEPLMTWLTQANTKSKECIGWGKCDIKLLLEIVYDVIFKI